MPWQAKAQPGIRDQLSEHQQRQAVSLTCDERRLGLSLVRTGENFLQNARVYRGKPDRQQVRWGRCGKEFAC